MPFAPKAGKLTTIAANGVGIQLEQCDVEMMADMIPASCFGQTPDADGMYWKQKLGGLNASRMTMAGKWDDGAKPTGTGGGKPNIRAGFNIQPTITLYAGVSFTLGGIVSQTRTSSKVEAGIDFACTIEGSGPPTYPA